MTLSDKSLKILELPEILNLLAAEAVSKAAKDLCLELTPYRDTDSVHKALLETSAAKTMMVLKQSPPFSGVKDIRSIVSRADMGGVLNIRELLDVSELLRAAASSVSYFKNDKKAEETAIDYLFNALISDKPLRDKIESAIISEEEIADNASSELAGIRRLMRLTEEKVRQTLNKFITSSTYAKALQEPIITVKNNRYVVPVKVEHKQTIPGMVHDISSSGATHFVEPMAVVNLNNELRELSSREEAEIERILTELSADVALNAHSIINDFKILTKLDFIFAKAKLSYLTDAALPELSQEKSVKLHKARHPLLPKAEAIPIDIHIGGGFDTLIITGPNTGGKTVTLKTLGLLCAMAACGLHIPAGAGSSIFIFSDILADIGDEQSIEQSLSTFSSHMTNIVGILDIASCDSLLLFDELGAGTDPVEGAALAISVIEHARKSKALIAATTHYAELKEYALSTNGVINASCEFNIETLKPTYKLIIGLPGKSNAFAISKQLGLSDNIIEDAKSRINAENAAFEDTLRGLEDLRLVLENERTETERLLRSARAEKLKADEIRDELNNDRNRILEKAEREAEQIISEARDTAMSVINEAEELGKRISKETDFKLINEEKANLLKKLNEAKKVSGKAKAKQIKKTGHTRDIAAGDRVIIDNIGISADVISVGSDGTLSLQAGIIKVNAHINEVTLTETKEKQNIKKHIAKTASELRTQAAETELDIRGLSVDEAIPLTEQFIDNAKMARLSSVTIIHGKGTGTLRKAVHKNLKENKRSIKSYRLGVYGEGEDGVTIVELK